MRPGHSSFKEDPAPRLPHWAHGGQQPAPTSDSSSLGTTVGVGFQKSARASDRQ
jgi:hypothetical protein